MTPLSLALTRATRYNQLLRAHFDFIYNHTGYHKVVGELRKSPPAIGALASGQAHSAGALGRSRSARTIRGDAAAATWTGGFSEKAAIVAFDLAVGLCYSFLWLVVPGRAAPPRVENASRDRCLRHMICRRRWSPFFFVWAGCPECRKLGNAGQRLADCPAACATWRGYWCRPIGFPGDELPWFLGQGTTFFSCRWE